MNVAFKPVSKNFTSFECPFIPFSSVAEPLVKKKKNGMGKEGLDIVWKNHYEI